jgi:hypothetical protein
MAHVSWGPPVLCARKHDHTTHTFPFWHPSEHRECESWALIVLSRDSRTDYPYSRSRLYSSCAFLIVKPFGALHFQISYLLTLGQTTLWEKRFLQFNFVVIVSWLTLLYLLPVIRKRLRVQLSSLLKFKSWKIKSHKNIYAEFNLSLAVRGWNGYRMSGYGLPFIHILKL